MDNRYRKTAAEAYKTRCRKGKKTPTPTPPTRLHRPKASQDSDAGGLVHLDAEVELDLGLVEEAHHVGGVDLVLAGLFPSFSGPL